MIPTSTDPGLQRLLDNVKEDERGCWVWMGAKLKNGRGQVSFKGKVMRAYHVFYLVFNGPVPEGLILRHRCHNPSCCNPKHVQAGTYEDNALDSGDDKRGHFKLTRISKEAILGSDLPAKKIAEIYGISLTWAHKLCARRRELRRV